MSTNQPPKSGQSAYSGPGSGKIQHSQLGFGPRATGPGAPPGAPQLPGAPAPATPAPLAPPPAEEAALPVAGGGPASAGNRIRTFEKGKRHEEDWSRSPNTTGQGAIHVKTFSCKLTEDALDYMDQTINEWLDAHPQYEVKFVSSSIGILTGKLKEPALICQVWV